MAVAIELAVALITLPPSTISVLNCLFLCLHQNNEVKHSTELHPLSHVFTSPYLVPHPYSHTHELLAEPWSDFTLDPPLGISPLSILGRDFLLAQKGSKIKGYLLPGCI